MTNALSLLRTPAVMHDFPVASLMTLNELYPVWYTRGFKTVGYLMWKTPSKQEKNRYINVMKYTDAIITPELLAALSAAEPHHADTTWDIWQATRLQACKDLITLVTNSITDHERSVRPDKAPPPFKKLTVTALDGRIKGPISIQSANSASSSIGSLWPTPPPAATVDYDDDRL
jgi:hypothetical protein